MQERTKGRWERHEQTKLRGWLVPDAFPSRASAALPARSEVTNWSQIETRVSDKLYSLARELTPSARYTVLFAKIHVGTRTHGRNVSLHITIDKSLGKCFRKFSEYISWIAKKQEEVTKESAHDCLASINFKREISSGILKDLEKLHVDCRVIHRECSDNLVRKSKGTTVVIIFITI